MSGKNLKGTEDVWTYFFYCGWKCRCISINTIVFFNIKWQTYTWVDGTTTTTKLAVFSLSSMRTLVINWKDYESDREKHWLKFNCVFSWLIPVNKSRLQKALELATSPFKINSSHVLYIGTKISFPFSLIVCV